MGDLISRSDLLKKFDDAGIQITFNLPVEEILGEDVDIDDFAMLVQDAIQAYKKMVIGTINEQPTAYNVEKVIEETHNYFCKIIDDYNTENIPDEILKYNKEICNIVKRGGVDD